jgi:UDP-N-acetylenolpyruvoylglucosamine reductase
MKVEKNKNLKSFNFYNLDLETKYFIELKSKKDFEEAFCWIQEKKIKKVFILAEGSNIIFKKEFFDGVILKVSNGFTK